ncbi:MAG: MCE family protein [Acidobacteriia bacterium]|nr:MCE family protein [Terriglobia bacterium]
MQRRWVVVLIVVVGLAAISTLIVGNIRLSRQELKSCFSDVQGLRARATVRIAGVDVGTVRSVRANPQNKNCTAEVEMALATSYDLRVPKDAIAVIETAGILGESYVDIDVSQASGTPLENHGYLKSKSAKPLPSAEELLKALDTRLATIDASIASEKTSKGNAGPPAQPTKP